MPEDGHAGRKCKSQDGACARTGNVCMNRKPCVRTGNRVYEQGSGVRTGKRVYEQETCV